MRYRAMSADFDYTFGQGQANFLINTPVAVAQAVLTRMRLITGEWFLDLREGLPLYTDIIGKNTLDLYDQAIKLRVLDTQGVTEIVSYASQLDREARQLRVQLTIDTVYGIAATFSTVLPL